MKKKLLVIFTLVLECVMALCLVACDKDKGDDNKGTTDNGTVVTPEPTPDPDPEPTHTHVFDKEVATADFLKSDATCTAKAVYYKSCTCGAKGTETFTYGEAKGHTYGEWINEESATCESAGTKGHYHCSACDKDFDAEKAELASLVINAKGHTYGTWIDEVSATCETAGTLGHYHCDGCNKDFDTNHNELASLVINAKGHTYGTWIDEVSATCETAGTKGHYHCSACDKDFDTNHNELASLVINATGHTYATVWSKDATKHWYASTCGCDVKKDEATHTFNYKGVCTVCGYDSCSTLGLGYTFDNDNSKGTGTAVANTKWYAKVSLTAGTSYLASCTNKNKYIIKICDKDGLELCEFSSESNNFYQFNATYTGDYYISILKTANGDYKPLFYIASVQNMTSPFDSESASNSATFAAGEFKAFSFTLAADCSIKFNGAFGEDDYMDIISSDMASICQTSYDYVNHFQVAEDLSADTYYFVDYYTTADVTVNYYLVCGHNFGDNDICDVCGYTCTHTSKNAYDICDTCGHFIGTNAIVNGDAIEPTIDDDGCAYYEFTLSAGKYRLLEDLGSDTSTYNFYLYAEDAADNEYTVITPSTTLINIDEDGVYYLVIEEDIEGNYGNGGHAFQLLEDLTSNLITNGSYTATSISDGNTYYYIIDITTAGIYTFTYDDEDGDVVDDISIVGQTAIDGSTDYKLNKGRYILQVDVETVFGGDILINCVYSQCISTDGSLTTGLTVAHGGKVYFQINLEEGDYGVREGSTLEVSVIFKLGGVIVGSSDSFSIDEELGAGTYYVVAYNAGTDTTTGAFGIQ